MKILFASLICHRDVEIFKFNWFCMRTHLDRGFDFQHLLLNDGSLTDEDKIQLQELPNVILDPNPITLYDVPKAVLLGKLECLKRGFGIYSADRVVVFDCDIFFLRNWESDLRKILTERTVVLRDWGSSIGPNVDKYFKLFGVKEDLTTPNCNSGIISVLKEDYHKINEKLKLHIKNPFMIMEDQGALIAAFHGQLSYVNNIMCLINNIEYNTKEWEAILTKNAVHLMGMRVRSDALKSLVKTCLNNLPNYLHLSQFEPINKFISWGLMEYGHYNFSHPLQKLPTTFNGEYVNDCLNLHGGSNVSWSLPERCTKFTTKIVCLDTGIPSNVKPIKINDKYYYLNEEINIPVHGKLEIITQDGQGTHLAFLEPRVYLDKLNWPDLSLQKE